MADNVEASTNNSAFEPHFTNGFVKQETLKTESFISKSSISTENSIYLFNKAILENPVVLTEDCKSILTANPNLILRPLSSNDFSKGYIDLLKQLTTVGDVLPDDFYCRFQGMFEARGTYYIVVLEDSSTNHLIGSGTLVIEQKFIHNASSRGRIEDLVIDSAYRGKSLGKLLSKLLTNLGKHLGVYKMSLECHDDLLPFYCTFGYQKEEKVNYVLQRFKD